VTEGGLGTILARIEGWGAQHAAASVVGPDGVIASHGNRDRRFRWASVTKPITAMAALVAFEQGSLDLDEPAGPPGATVRHLLAHTSGLPFEGKVPLAAPGARRIYSNPGFDAVGALLAERAGRPFVAVLRDTVLEPLGMTATELVERPSDGLHGPLRDLEAFVAELLTPSLIGPATLAMAMTTAFPGLVGVVPGVGRFDPCDWALGFEVRDGKSPHWTGTANSPATVGHFGGAGTFFWVDTTASLGLAVLTDRGFDAWAMREWPPFSDAVLEALAV
jgi:CubicO group peptidase (beta-lactamase class C family)